MKNRSLWVPVKASWKLGLVAWFLFLIIKGLPGLQEIEWVQLLLVFAPLVVVPLGLELAFSDSRIKFFQEKFTFPFALLFTTAFYFESGLAATLLALPWLIYALVLLLQVLQKRRPFPIFQIASILFLVIGAAWSLADRMAFQPLGFDPVIVLLTGAHFHYAGFVLVVLCHLLQKYHPDIFKPWIGILVLAGIPAVAFGITASHFGWNPVLEAGAGLVMVLGGVSVAWLYSRLAQHLVPKVAAIYFYFGALALFLAMILAGLYAVRVYYPISWLSIPWMYAVHGSLNTFGSGFFLLLAWYLYKKSLPFR